jgi:hypothetical protein
VTARVLAPAVLALALSSCAIELPAGDEYSVAFPLPGEVGPDGVAVGVRDVPADVESIRAEGVECDHVKPSTSGTDYVLGRSIRLTLRATGCDPTAPPGRVHVTPKRVVGF